MTNRTTPGLSYTTRRLCKCSIQMCLSPFLHTPSIQVKPRPPVIRSKQAPAPRFSAIGFLYCMGPLWQPMAAQQQSPTSSLTLLPHFLHAPFLEPFYRQSSSNAELSQQWQQPLLLQYPNSGRQQQRTGVYERGRGGRRHGKDQG